VYRVWMDKMKSLCQQCFYHQSIIYYTFIKSIQVSINLLDITEIHNTRAISIHMSQWQRIHKYSMRNVHIQHKINTVISQSILPIKSWHTTRCTTDRGKKIFYSVCHLLCSGTTMFSRWVGTCLPLQHNLHWWMGEYVCYSEKIIFICKPKWGPNSASLARNLKIVTKYFSSTVRC
jgi:hypothetical protein